MSNDLETTTLKETLPYNFEGTQGWDYIAAAGVSILGTIFLAAGYAYATKKVKQLRDYINNRLDNMCE